MRKGLQFFWLLISAFVARHKKYIILGTLIGFLATLFILQAYPLYSKISGLKPQKIGIVGRYIGSNLPLFIQNQLSLGLTVLTRSGEATASLAKSWEIDSTEKIYTLHLRDNLYWHDGKRFTSKDINYKIKDAVVTAVDQITLKVALKEPYSPLPTLLSYPLFRPNLVGLGLYKAVKIQYSGETISELTLKSVILNLNSIVYKFYPSNHDAILAFKLGEVDILQNISTTEDLSVWKNMKITNVNLYDSFIGVFFNLKDPLFKEKETRQVLSYAIPNIEEITKAYTPISPLSWAYSSKIRLYRYDPEAAAKTLSKSPLSSPSTEITLTTYASLLKTAQFVADAWNKVGVKTKIKVVNSIPNEYQVLVMAQAIPADPDQYQFWQSTQPLTNLTHYSNLKVDKLLEDGRKTFDFEKRKKIYADFQRYLVDDAPVIFLHYPRVYMVERK